MTFRTYLHTADQAVRNVRLKELTASVLLAAPTPDILPIASVLAHLQYSCSNAPHDDTEGVETDREGCVVGGNFLTSFVALSPERPNYKY